MLTSPTKPRLTLATTPPSPSTYYHLLYVDPAKRDSLMATNVPRSTKSSRTPSIHSVSSDAGSDMSSTAAHSTLSLLSPKYMDDHFPLITNLHLDREIPTHVPHTHKAVWAAHHMAEIHNTLIRALNSCYNNCLSVQPGTQRATDFLFFNTVIVGTLLHHHHTEDEYLFPALENLLGQPGALHENTEQHESFMEGFTAYHKYVTSTSAADYNGLALRHIIDFLAPKLIEHFHDEIPSLLSLSVVTDEEAMAGIWAAATEMALTETDISIVGPFFLGCQDKSFRIDNMPGEFPGFPESLEKTVQHELSLKHRGAWEFCPSDWDGRRKTLATI